MNAVNVELQCNVIFKADFAGFLSLGLFFSPQHVALFGYFNPLQTFQINPGMVIFVNRMLNVKCVGGEGDSHYPRVNCFTFVSK